MYMIVLYLLYCYVVLIKGIHTSYFTVVDIVCLGSLPQLLSTSSRKQIGVPYIFNHFAVLCATLVRF